LFGSVDLLCFLLAHFEYCYPAEVSTAHYHIKLLGEVVRTSVDLLEGVVQCDLSHRCSAAGILFMIYSRDAINYPAEGFGFFRRIGPLPPYATVSYWSVLMVFLRMQRCRTGQYWCCSSVCNGVVLVSIDPLPPYATVSYWSVLILFLRMQRCRTGQY